MKKKLQLHIGGFTTQAKGEKCTGRIRIGLVLRTRSDRILYRKSDTLTPHQDHIKITVNLFWLKKGSYKITVKVRDLLSGRSTHRTIEPVVE